MSISQFAYDPPNGWRDHNRFPTYESEEAQVRDDMQELHDQVRDYINNTVVAKWNSSKAEQAALLPTSGANMKYLRLNTNSNVIETSTDGASWASTANSGHVILDGNGDAVTQRPRLRFMGSTVTDSDGTTVVNGLNVISAATETPLTGVLMGASGNVTAVPLETELVELNYPITSAAVKLAVEDVQISSDRKVVSVSVTGLNHLPMTYGVPNMTGTPDFNEDLVPISIELSNPDAQVDDWVVTTGSAGMYGTVTIEGEIFGATNATLTFVLPYQKAAIAPIASN